MSKTLLITNSRKKHDRLNDWCQKNSFTLISQSFIQIQSIPDLTIPDTEWIFFSSPNSVNSFFENYALSAQKIAVYGKGTEEILNSFGYQADFIGPNTTDAKKIAEELEQIVNGRILFPISQRSRRSIIKHIKQCEVVPLITYHTQTVAKKLDRSPAVILFTSPSNIEGFLLANKIEKDQILVSMGDTTAAALNQFAPNNKCYNLKSADIDKLIDLLVDLFNDRV